MTCELGALCARRSKLMFVIHRMYRIYEYSLLSILNVAFPIFTVNFPIYLTKYQAFHSHRVEDGFKATEELQ